MYAPEPFLISTAALTSIFSFFFGEYFRQREEIYRLWIKVFAYDYRDSDEETEDEIKELCSFCESKERMFRQAKNLLRIMLLTLILCYVVFHFYSIKYFWPTSPLREVGAFHTYFWYSLIISIILLINCLEIMYIVFTLDTTDRFPFLKLRRRVTAQDRLSMIWQHYGCPGLKLPLHDRSRIPRKFYKDLESTYFVDLSDQD
jgi:hypothetical protein